MASLKSEPLIFSCDDPSLTDAPKKITLLVNPEALTINWKKVITRTRTKSRIVSFYWGQEPISLAYTGQTGSLIPTQSLLNSVVDTQAANDYQTMDDFDNALMQLQNERKKKEEELALLLGGPNAASVETEIAEIDANIKTIQENQTQIIKSPLTKPISLLTTTSVLDALGDSSHTDLIKKSEKYQRFDQLRKFYEATQNVNILTKLLYRHWVFEGYFESFGFTDDAKSPWNWNYSLTFIILNWQETGSYGGGGNELLLVPDEA